MNEKDAYDIYYCVEHFPGGTDKLAAKISSLLRNKLILEGLGKIRGKFAPVKHISPAWIADFLKIAEKEYMGIIMRRAYKKANVLLNFLRIALCKG
jgi:hypothetical protein